MTPFTPGQQVKLTGNLLKARMQTRRIDWLKRRGAVSHCNNYSVYVVWNGCKSAEELPVRAVEVAAGSHRS
jgi:hypothetical protein